MPKASAGARQKAEHLSEKLETLRTIFAPHNVAPGPNGTIAITMREPEYKTLLKALEPAAE